MFLSKVWSKIQNYTICKKKNPKKQSYENNLLKTIILYILIQDSKQKLNCKHSRGNKLDIIPRFHAFVNPKDSMESKRSVNSGVHVIPVKLLLTNLEIRVWGWEGSPVHF